ncbi:DUF805 domain-containing protein [Streptomyces europaeiscabiei]|uniref:DUF805 domain-containing protein n=1 Tax=Streptomyces europaeiscabiei TaxID=146819 RepID=UPI0038D3B4DF
MVRTRRTHQPALRHQPVRRGGHRVGHCIGTSRGTTSAPAVAFAGLGFAIEVPLSVLVVPLIAPMLSISVRRLHDTGKSGGRMLVALIPIVGAIVHLVGMTVDSAPGANQYGPSPKAASWHALVCRARKRAMLCDRGPSAARRTTLGRAPVAPAVQADLFLRQHLSRVDQQVAQEPVLGGGEVEWSSGVTPGVAGHVVQDQVPVTGHARTRMGAPAVQQDLGPRQDLGRPEGPGDVVLPPPPPSSGRQVWR